MVHRRLEPQREAHFLQCPEAQPFQGAQFGVQLAARPVQGSARVERRLLGAVARIGRLAVFEIAVAVGPAEEQVPDLLVEGLEFTVQPFVGLAGVEECVRHPANGRGLRLVGSERRLVDIDLRVVGPFLFAAFFAVGRGFFQALEAVAEHRAAGQPGRCLGMNGKAADHCKEQAGKNDADPKRHSGRLR